MPRSHIVRSSLNYFPAHQPAATNSMHLQSSYTPYLQHLSNRRRIWNPMEYLRWSVFAEIVDIFRPLAIFCRRASSWMFHRILDATLFSNLLQLAEGLSRTFSSLGLHNRILGPPCLLMFLIYTKHKTKIRNLGLTSRLHFTSLKLYKRSQIPHSSPRVVSTSSRTVEQKPTTTSLSIYKYSHDRSEEKLSNPWGNKKKSWTHLPSSFL